MWSNIDQEALAREEMVRTGHRSPQEVEQIVVLLRLNLYNRGLPCGATALRRRLHEHHRLNPLPSSRRIGEILNRYGLTYGRTGWYEGDEPDGLPALAQTPKAERR